MMKIENSEWLGRIVVTKDGVLGEVMEVWVTPRVGGLWFLVDEGVGGGEWVCSAREVDLLSEV